MYQPEGFLSTLSLRRATAWSASKLAGMSISIHALLAESDRNADCNYHSARPISIHALLAESDIVILRKRDTPLTISIHALLAESDAKIMSVSNG